MLEELDIRDFALIEHVTIPFGKGFNVLTGETGAGKSILIDALNAVLGGKTGPGSIRPGADRATIEATFVGNAAVSGWLKQQELQNDDLERLVVGREIGKSGSKMRINGTLVNAATVQELRQQLFTMHAQHEARTLMSGQSQLDMIDGLGDAAHKKLEEKVRTLWTRKRDLVDELNELTLSAEERLRKLDFLRFQLRELEEAHLSDPDEDETTANQVRVLANVAQLEESSLKAQERLSGDEAGAVSAIDLIQEAAFEVERAAAMDGTLTGLNESIATALAALEDASRSLRRYREALDTDPESLAGLEARLAQLATIKRKYGPTLTDALSRLAEVSAEISRLENAQGSADEIASELAAVSTELDKVASNLSGKRQAVAGKLAASIKTELVDLGMERCRFEIAFETVDVGASGLDRVEFLIAPNPGQPLLPIAKIASGGELSRVMLAVKSIVAGADQVSTVVFDEIDTGISGKVLQTMRDKLARLAGSHQILCITHQPVIASVADNHLQVEKSHSDVDTRVSVRVLGAEDRVRALAGMASGHEDREESLRFARSLFDEAGRLKRP